MNAASSHAPVVADNPMLTAYNGRKYAVTKSGNKANAVAVVTREKRGSLKRALQRPPINSPSV